MSSTISEYTHTSELALFVFNSLIPTRHTTTRSLSSLCAPRNTHSRSVSLSHSQDYHSSAILLKVASSPLATIAFSFTFRHTYISLSLCPDGYMPRMIISNTLSDYSYLNIMNIKFSHLVSTILIVLLTRFTEHRTEHKFNFTQQNTKKNISHFMCLRLD